MRAVGRWLVLLVAAIFALQLFFVARIGLMAVVNPQSSAFERSEAWRLTTEKDTVRWRQQWVDYDEISDHLKRAVIASEDDGFLFHDGVEWDALEKAWERNAKTQSMLEAREQAREQARKKPSGRTPKIIGGSTITQQLAKNLFLSGERLGKKIHLVQRRLRDSLQEV